MERRYFSKKVVEWYESHKRDLPWRNTTDPYKIWLSEIILQQTRVAQGLPYYQRFLESFPDVVSLASASEQKILRLWQGLGYYTRARNLHKCAQVVVNEFSGVFPNRFSDLIKLPGVGEYTAAAIASFSADEKVAVLDGNVFRVLSRINGETAPINTPDGKRIFSAMAAQWLPESNTSTYNQAVMEFGALWCTPRAPRCSDCFYKKRCVAAAGSLQSMLPVKIRKQKTRKRYFNYFVFRKGNELLMKKRETNDIWKGLYDFYLVETNDIIKPEKILKEDPLLRTISVEKANPSESYQHVLTHQTIISRFFVMDMAADFSVAEPSMSYYGFGEIHELPKPVLITRFLKDYNFL